MVDPKHTPGTWERWDRVPVEHDVSLRSAHPIWAVDGDGRQRVAYALSDADADLIAAAPELLAALENIVANEEKTGIYFRPDGPTKSAIAKAKGERTDG